ncbi:hypothetical protein BDZ89DRAFT_1131124 [Hymenopellis radicata]|nr:hypothetical protein BDZ89DRAFT_1131124 [Hymenopellis radicata]
MSPLWLSPGKHLVRRSGDYRGVEVERCYRHRRHASPRTLPHTPTRSTATTGPFINIGMFRELDGLFVSLFTLVVGFPVRLIAPVLSMDRHDDEQPPTKSSLPVSLQPLLLSATLRNSSTRTTIVPEAGDDDEQEQPSPFTLPLSTRPAMRPPLYEIDCRCTSHRSRARN